VTGREPAADELRRALLEQLLDEEGLAPEDSQPPLGTDLPTGALSAAQERLWFLDQLQPGGTDYLMPAVWHLPTAVDDDALRRSFDVVVARHQVLRTRFELQAGRPVQLVEPQVTVPFRVVDLRGLPEERRADELDHEIARTARQPFDLAVAPLLRACLVRVGWTRNVLVVVVHHIAADGWSLDVLHRDLAAVYSALVEGAPSPLPDLPLQYAAYAAGQQAWLRSTAAKKELAYWQEQLHALPTLDFPTDLPRPVVQSTAGARQGAAIDGRTLQQIRALCDSEGVTLFMVLLAAWAALLHRCTGATDIPVGTSCAGRNRPELEELVGVFLNTLVLRVDLGDDPSFRELLGRMRRCTLAAYEHQDIPFEAVLEALQPPRDSSRTPLFQAYFNLLNYGDDSPLHGMDDPEPAPTAARFDLSLYASEAPDRVELALVYATALFDHSTGSAILRALQILLTSAVRHPDAPVSSLTVEDCPPPHEAAASPAVPRPRTALPWPADADPGSLVARFDSVAARHGSNAAVVTSTGEWTYTGLAAASRHVARHVVTELRGRQGRVGLLLDHGAQAVAAVLGVLRAGCSYVPLDGRVGVEELRRRSADAGITVMVTDAGNQAAARVASGSAAVVDLDTCRCGFDVAHHDGVGVTITAGDEAYVLYTSGSTRTARGVLQTHGGVMRNIGSYARRLGLGVGDRVSLIPALGFDAAVMDLFGALLSGACLVPIDVRSAGFDGLAGAIERHGVSVVHGTPTVLRNLVAARAEAQPLVGVRAVVLGGEQVFRSDVESLRRAFAPPCVVINGYGPTEATVCTQFVADHRTELLREQVPIGRPVGDVQIRIVSPGGAVVPTGLPGELLVRGAHVACGYLGDPVLTARQFLATGVAGVRELRTGDRVRRLASGDLLFEGRVDRQVKVRGFRVDLGEIEGALMRISGVREAAVVEAPTASGVVAFLTSAWQVRHSATDLRRQLRGNLPDYMVPDRIRWLDELPVLPTGKVDRQSLRRQAAEEPRNPEGHEATGQGGEAEADDVLTVVLDVWRELFREPAVAGGDDFFVDLGGHSLLAIQALSRLRDRTGVMVPMTEFFQKPTAAAVAARIRAQGVADVPGPGRDVALPAQARRTQRFVRDKRGRISLLDGEPSP
jgi:amino acid adenylation domain-containing protein